jgi:hypothetical protein
MHQAVAIQGAFPLEFAGEARNSDGVLSFEAIADLLAGSDCVSVQGYIVEIECSARRLRSRRRNGFRLAAATAHKHEQCEKRLLHLGHHIADMPQTIREECAGKVAAFLVPSLKLKDRARSGVSLEEKIHRFLLRHFDGYTATAGNIFGYWKDDRGEVSYGEHKEHKVALKNDRRLAVLRRFLAEIAAEMNEKCIYLESGKEASFVYATRKQRA